MGLTYPAGQLAPGIPKWWGYRWLLLLLSVCMGAGALASSPYARAAKAFPTKSLA